MALHQCPSCGKASFEEVAESGEWWWMCHECDYTEEDEDSAWVDYDPDMDDEDEPDDEEYEEYSWGGYFDEEEE
jgi:ribosomal protein S27AE